MNIYEMSASLSLDTSEYQKGLEGATNQTSMFGDMLKANLASDVILGGLKAIGSACATAVQGIAGIVQASVEATAQFEQLSGGVETLFKDSGDVVMQNAQNAFKTAGMSANEYMETVTSFSASLIASLDGDTAKASEKADQAIQQMSDNANKMGSSMESIQNAYQGFAKQNYTMLDNLKLGYGGTKEEMQRLLQDAEKLSGQKFDISSYADIVDAIKVVQDEMGITGTTAKEASTTIEGSLNSMKSAWENAVMGISNGDGNFDVYIQNLVDSVVTFGENIIPVVEQAMTGLGDLVTQLAPVIAERIPTLIEEVLPALVESAGKLLSSLGSAIVENLPMLLQTALDLVLFLGNGLVENLPSMIPQIVQLMIQISNTLLENLPMLIDCALQIILALADGLIQSLPMLIENLPTIIENIVTTLVTLAPKLVEASLQLILALGKGLIENIPRLVESIPKIVTGIVNAFTKARDKFLDIGKNIVMGIKDGINQWWDNLVQEFIQKVQTLLATIKGFLGIHSPSKVFAEIGMYMAQGMGVGWDDEFGSIKKGIINDMDFSSVGVVPAQIGTAFGANSAGTVYNQTINVNQQIATADELARAVRIESRYGLMRGVALG